MYLINSFHCVSVGVWDDEVLRGIGRCGAGGELPIYRRVLADMAARRTPVRARVGPKGALVVRAGIAVPVSEVVGPMPLLTGNEAGRAVLTNDWWCGG